MIVDRPRDRFVTLKNGKKALINYSWGEPSNSIPVRARVIVQADSGKELVLPALEGPFDSLEQINEIGTAVANNWYEKGNG